MVGSVQKESAVQLSNPVIALIVMALAVILWVSVLSHIFIKAWENADKASKRPTKPPVPREWHEEVTGWEHHAHEPENRRRFEDWN